MENTKTRSAIAGFPDATHGVAENGKEGILIMKKFEGVLAALLTPYDSDGKVNHKVLKRQVR